MSDEEVEVPDEGEEEGEQVEKIEDLFDRSLSDDQGDQQDSDVLDGEDGDGARDHEGPDEEREADEGLEDGNVDRGELDGESERENVAEGDDLEGFDDGGDASWGTGASGIDEDLLAADDRQRAPEFSAGKLGDVGWHSTGIDELDEHLGGGIPPGRILSFVAPADAQSELLVKHLAAQHDCLYLSTLRPKWEVEEEVRDYVQKSAVRTGETSVQIEQLTADSRLDSARRHIETLESSSIVVIDSANELEEQEKERYVYFIDELKRTLWETGSVGLFYCVEQDQPPVGRDVTLRRADLIWHLQQAVEPDRIRHRLAISKFRGGRALKKPLTLSLTDVVVVESNSDDA